MPKKFLSLYLPPLLWCALIFYLSSIPHLQVTDEKVMNFLTRKLAHLVEYGILVFLIFRATGYKKAYLSIMLTIIYALTDEIHQKFVPLRTGKLSDIIFDATGALLGLYTASLWKKQLSLPKKLKRLLKRS